MNIIIEIQSVISNLQKNRKLIFHLALRDFKIKYARNYFGLAWAILEPLAMLLIMLIVFTYLRQRTNSQFPFVVYLLSGLAGYDFFSRSLSQGTQSIKSFSFMINLVHVPTSLIPIVSILSNFWTHLFFLVIAIFVLMLNGVRFSFYWFQLGYFMFATWMLLIGVTWLTSAIVVFVRDLQFVISIAMRALFFLTPIFWELQMFPEKYHKFFKLNPLFHIVEGYRMCLLYHKPFWSDGFAMISFWTITLIFLVVGAHVFKKLSPNFADVTR